MPDYVRLYSEKIVNSIEGSISFNNVSFSYDEKNIFKDLSFIIPVRSSVAFLGESGSGKSIIVKQIMELNKPDSGSI